ncbi:MAG: MBL fold metallo-hydrolase [Chloroflexota bacterium]
MDEVRRIVVPTSFPIGPVNSYLIVGDELALVDVGPRVPGAYEAMVQGLAEQGYAPKDVKRLVISHAHTDHFGLARQFVEESGAQVCTHEANVPLLSNYLGEWQRRIEYYLEFYRGTGAGPEAMRGLEGRYRFVLQFAEGVRVDVPLRDGDWLTLGSRQWQVLHTPGHSGGAMCLYQPETRKLIVGDHLLKEVTSNPIVEVPTAQGGKRPRSLVEYLRSLARIEQLDVDITYPGHGELIYDHRALIRERYEFHRARKELMLDAVRRGRQTAHEIAVELFPSIPAFEMPLALFEVIGHLDLLEAEGRVRCVPDGEVWRYYVA